MSAILFLLFLGTLLSGIGLGIYRALGNTETTEYGRKTTKQTFAIGKFLLFAVAGLVLSFVPLTLFSGYSPVEQGYVGVVKRMGAVTGTLQPGPHFVTPFITTVDPVTTKTLTVKPSEDASSQDLQQVHTEVTLTYHFDQDGIVYIYSNLIDNSPNAVENKVVIPAILEAIKASTAKYTVQDLVQKRAQVRDDIEMLVKSRLVPYHITAETTSITDFRFSDSFEKSIEAKQVAQQQAEQAQNELKKVQIEAEQRIAQAKGEADASKAQLQALTPELLQLRWIEKWDGKLPENYYGGAQGPLPIVDALRNKK